VSDLAFLARLDDSLNRLLQVTRKGMTSSTLINIHNRAIKSYLDSNMTGAIREAIDIFRRTRDDLTSWSAFVPGSKLYERFYEDMQRRVCSAFKIEPLTDNHVDAKISTVYASEHKPSRLALSLTKVGQALATIYTAAATQMQWSEGGQVVLIASLMAHPGLYWLSNSQKQYTGQILLSICAMIVLILERAFWFGGHRPTLDQVARAAVEGQALMAKLSQDVRTKRHQKVDDMVQLTELVQKYRFRPPVAVLTGDSAKANADDSDFEDVDDGEDDPQPVPEDFLDEFCEDLDLHSVNEQCGNTIEDSESSEESQYATDPEEDIDGDGTHAQMDEKGVSITVMPGSFENPWRD